MHHQPERHQMSITELRDWLDAEVLEATDMLEDMLHDDEELPGQQAFLMALEHVRRQL
jgi:hypothetical protein